MTDNELIAQFMGGIKKIVQDPKVQHGYPVGTVLWYGVFDNDGPLRFLEFDSSWDWLMPVVDAIEELEEPHPSNNPEKGTVWPYQFEILSRTTVQIVDNRNDNSIVLINQDGLTRIESVYKAVVEFIKFYNDKNKTE